VVLSLGLLAFAGGCAHDVASQHLVTSPSSPPPDAVVHKAQDLPKRQPMPATLVSFGDVYQRGAAEPGRTAAQKEQMLDQARKAYQQALKLDPKHVPAYVSLARLYESTDDHERAVASYRKALDLKPKDAELWHDLGMCQARKKEWDKALQALAKASDLDPENKAYARSLGFCQARAGQYEKSFATLSKVEGEAQAHYNVARMLHHVKQDDMSKEHLRLALQTNPQLTEAAQLLVELETGAPAYSPNAAPAAPVQGTGKS
jgi:tetratricopeptide (TPR) repeat protein